MEIILRGNVVEGQRRRCGVFCSKIFDNVIGPVDTPHIC